MLQDLPCPGFSVNLEAIFSEFSRRLRGFLRIHEVTVMQQVVEAVEKPILELNFSSAGASDT